MNEGFIQSLLSFLTMSYKVVQKQSNGRYYLYEVTKAQRELFEALRVNIQ